MRVCDECADVCVRGYVCLRLSIEYVCILVSEYFVYVCVCVHVCPRMPACRCEEFRNM